jgi:Fe-S-cluster containining protein
VTDENEEQWQPGMPISEAEAIALLDDLYATLPALECKGRCSDTCTSIDASELERRRLDARGVNLPDASATTRMRVHQMVGTTPRCPALTSFNTCGVYDVRPFVCRAFGMVLDPGTPTAMIYRSVMMCDHGCVPDGTISVAQFVKVLDKIEVLSRQVTGVKRRETIQDAMDRLLPPTKPSVRPKRKGGKKCRKHKKS